jgi:hypothetical protein
MRFHPPNKARLTRICTAHSARVSFVHDEKVAASVPSERPFGGGRIVTTSRVGMDSNRRSGPLFFARRLVLIRRSTLCTENHRFRGARLLKSFFCSVEDM